MSFSKGIGTVPLRVHTIFLFLPVQASILSGDKTYSALQVFGFCHGMPACDWGQ